LKEYCFVLEDFLEGPVDYCKDCPSRNSWACPFRDENRRFEIRKAEDGSVLLYEKIGEKEYKVSVHPNEEGAYQMIRSINTCDTFSEHLEGFLAFWSKEIQFNLRVSEEEAWKLIREWSQHVFETMEV
jgi:hypothetical protein